MKKFTKNCISLFLIAFLALNGQAQSNGDRAPSVPMYFEYDRPSEKAMLRWKIDPDAEVYNVYRNSSVAGDSPTMIGSVTGAVDSFELAGFSRGERQEYIVQKQSNGSIVGQGNIMIGVEAPLINWRGRCLLLIEKSLASPLAVEIDQWRADVLGDGWFVDTIHMDATEAVVAVKDIISNWYDENYDLQQSLFLLGHIPVPYSGNIAPDGHGDHVGAWPSDAFYGEFDGFWTDNSIDNVTARRDANKNIPGDGKYDQSFLTSPMDLQVGRVDFSNLPAFTDSEVELTRTYLNKNHAFRTKDFDVPRRAIIENNFASFQEGFAQNGWNNFVPFFGPDHVAYGNYDEVLKTDEYLCSYACGPGSYTSAGGIGNTSNLYASNEIQTVFTMNFGSYFGDWDSNNNFLRAALASGKVLTNAWAGRPNWHFFHMALGYNIGFSTAITQYNFTYPGQFGARSVHAALMGDPTLRLHAVAPITDLVLSENSSSIDLNWSPSADAEEGYAVYRKSVDQERYELLADGLQETNFTDVCLQANTEYSYLVKAIKLEQTASGSYYNSSVGLQAKGSVTESNLPSVDFSFSINWEQIELTNNSSGSEDYNWSFGDGNTSNEESVTHAFSESGNYEVCLIGSNPACGSDTICQLIDIQYSLPDSLDAVLIDPLCFGDENGSIDITAINGDILLQYDWSNGAVTQDISNLGAGSYELKITSSTGLSQMFTYNLTAPDSLFGEVLTTPSTGNDGTASATVFGGTPPYTFDWLNQDPQMLPPGEYILIVTDANGCTTEISYVVDMVINNEEVGITDLRVYPNPFGDRLVLEYVSSYSELSIHTINGQIQIKHQLLNNQDSYTLNLQDLPSGIYFIMLKGSEKVTVEKVIKH